MYLDDILIYTDDNKNGHVAVVWWVLEQLKKFSLFSNLKKYRFHQDEVWFFGFVVSSKGIRMEDKRIEVVKQWPKPQSVRDIQIFLKFANFYRRFIQGFSRITTPPTSMLKTSSTKLVELKKGVVEVGGENRASRGRGGLDGSGMDDVEVDGGKVRDNEVGKKVEICPSPKRWSRVFSHPELEWPLPNWDKRSSKLQSSTTLTWNVISGLRRMHQDMLLVESSVSWFWRIWANGIW